jgi:hypothetical protein
MKNPVSILLYGKAENVAAALSAKAPRATLIIAGHGEDLTR